MPANYVLLEKIVVGAAGASSVTFNSIPQTGYTDLVVKTSLRETGTSSVFGITFNGNTSGYSTMRLNGTGASAGSTSSSGAAAIDGIVLPGSDATASIFGNTEFYIPNYASANYKSVSIDAVTENNATTAYQRLIAGLWSNTAAITSISFATPFQNFVQYSTFYLYGVAKLGTTPAIAPKATGGDTIMTDGTYWYHAFKSSGTFTPLQGLSCDVLVVAGGGAGDNGGGGAGGVLAFATQSISTAQTITVGAGATVVSSGDANTNGTNSQFGSLTAAVGGGAGRYSLNGVAGGSGGGGGYPNKTGGAPTSGQGNTGGTGAVTGGGGGGGAGAVGTNASGTFGGTGGAGTNSVTNWGALSAALTATGTGVSGFIAGGGGGGSQNGVNPYPVLGGTGGGGTGNTGFSANLATSGVENTGSGGGGIYNNYPAGRGGSGLVIVRYVV
jgi:hypothetical protein